MFIRLYKKILIVVCVICFATPSYCSNWKALDRVELVGTMIVKRNSLPVSIKFHVVDKFSNNRYAVASNIIQVNKSDIECACDDSELAYVISHELGEIIVKNLNPKSKFYNEQDIDSMGVDLMINGGYNPLASISLLIKLKRTEEAEYIFDYILYNYPSKISIGYGNIVYNSFYSNLNSKIKEKISNKRKLIKFNKKQEKISKARNKRLTKYDPSISKLSAWDVTKDLLKSITEPEEK